MSTQTTNAAWAAALLLPLGALGAPGPVRAEEAAAGGDRPVALVEGVPITEDQLDRLIAAQLRELRQREYTLRSQALDELIAQRLIEKEAKARGVSAAVLVKAEVEDKATVTEAEVKSFYQANKDRFPPGTAEADALKQVEARLGPQRQRERRAAWVRELRQKGAVKVLLEPLRVEVALAGHPVRGGKDAPVTIVEFSDFQCPYCSRARPTVNRVRQQYGEQVRIVFRHFPLAFHAEAQKAGEAADCAGEQGRFWEMHDRLFEQQQKLQVADLKQHAADLGLDAAAFGQCLDSGRRGEGVRRDLEAGQELGVSGTPAFFINGRPLVGAQPFESFAQVIDDELARAGVEPRAAAAVPGAARQ